MSMLNNGEHIYANVNQGLKSTKRKQKKDENKEYGD